MIAKAGSRFHIPRVLLILFILGALLRIAAIELRPDEAMLIAPDEPEYLEIAQSLAQGHGFSFHGEPTAYRDLLFPAFAAAKSMVIGTRGVFYAQLLLDLCTTVLLFWLGRKWLNEKTRVWLAGAWLLYPAAILYTSLFLTETLSLFLWVLALCVFAWADGRKALPPYVILGFILGLLLLTRASGVVLVLAILIHLLYQRQVRATLIVFAVMFVTVLPWMLRNASAVGQFALNTNQGINLYIGNHPGTTGSYHFDEDEFLSGEGRARSEVERNVLATELARNYIRSHPLKTLALWPKKFAYFWSTDMALWAHYLPNPAAPSLAAQLHTAPWILLVLTGLAYIAITAGGVAGFVLVKAFPLRGVLILQIVLATLAALVTYGLPRYHAPLMPALMIGAAAWMQTPGAWRNAVRSHRWMLILLIALLLAIWMMEGYTIAIG